MRICHIITTISKGGAENHLIMLAKAQQELGHEVTIFPLKGPLELAEDFSSHNVNVDTSLYGKSFVAQLFRMRNQVFLDFDLIHAHLPQAEFLTLLLRNKPIVISRHFGGNFFPGRNPVISRILSRVASSNANIVIAISGVVKNHLLKNREICNPEKVVVVAYGFDSEQFIEKISKHNVPKTGKNSPKKFGSLARLSPEKDLLTLISAFKIHLQDSKHQNDVLEIYGEGRMKKSLELLISKENLDGNVRLMGRTMDAARTIKSFDIFVLTSKFEGFGMVFLEAMALKKPIICSRIDAALEVLGEEGAAIYFETGNPWDLADKMTNLDRYLSPAFKNHQSARLREFGIEKMLSEFEKVYNLASDIPPRAHFSRNR
jgi:glycosyltransferase involved in cell wall biosynthesis